MCERNGSEWRKIYIVAVLGVRFDLEFPPKSFLVRNFTEAERHNTRYVSPARHTFDVSERDLSSVGNRGEKKSALELMRVVLKGTSLNN